MGNRDRFDSKGYCVVNETGRDLVKTERLGSQFESVSRLISVLAALFHDLGKNNAWFHAKLRQVKKGRPIADYVRHEFISFLVMKALFEDFESDLECLVYLSDPDNVADRIEKAFLRAYKSPDFFAFGNTETRLSQFAWALKRSANRTAPLDAPDIAFPDYAQRPTLTLLSDAVLTHHRLTGARYVKNDNRVVACTDNLIANVDAPDMESLALHFTLPETTSPLWADKEWISKVATACAALAAVHPAVSAVDRKCFSIVGRTALVLADHKASSYGNRAFPAGDSMPDPNLVYANTNRAERFGALAETLGSHMLRVSEDCDLAYDVIFSHSFRFPGLEYDEIPAVVAEPRAEKDSAFRWQADASKITRNTLKANPSAGFFGVLMADTGAGKTRASSIIMTAAADKATPLRLSVCSGLRTLTLQTGREYTNDLRYPSDAVSVVIGDEITADLYRSEVGTVDTGSETDSLEGLDILRMDSGENERTLPYEVHDFVGNTLSSSTVSLLATPILVSTIDTLMPVADGRRTGQMAKTLRVATSDLVIDEIDNFGAEDVVAIARLVYLHAAYGRRVLISSATVYPEIAHSLFEAYEAGWEAHRLISGSDTKIVAGWYANGAACRCVEVDDVASFRTSHTAFVWDILSSPSAIRRKARISVEVVKDDTASYFASVSSEIMRLHRDNRIEDAKSGKRVSVGVVKWSNALPSMLYASKLSEEGLGDAVDVFVVPYNGTLYAGQRHLVETNLNRMLRRKPSGGCDPLLSDEVVRKILDTRSSAKDVVIVVVTTSMEETGRDHDFDWAVLEPGSQRSLIQIAGRVRRHRMAAYGAINITIMSRAFREVRLSEIGGRQHNVFAYPGFETPVARGGQNFDLTDHDASVCYDIDVLLQTVDAREAISPDLPSGAIARSERLLTAAYLDGSVIPDRAGVRDFLSDEMAFVHGHNMSRRRFRRSTGHDFTFLYQSEHQTWGVVIDPAVQTCPYVTDLTVNEDRLMLRTEDAESLQGRLAAEMWGDESVETWKARALLAVTRPLHTDKPQSVEFLAHPALGFVVKPTWLDRVDLVDF